MGARRRRRRAIYVEIEIAAPIDTVWELTQNTRDHPRWDLRFSGIDPVAELPSGGYRFRYERRLPFHTIVGTGTSLGESGGAGEARTSALRFDTGDRMSPLGAGRGYWRYVPTDRGTRFSTGYDYEPGFGRAGAILDRVLTRRLIGWMTAWSFDRLRIWAESGPPPERWPVLSVLAFWRPERPRAARCRRHPPARSDIMGDAPPTLDVLEAP